jgi:hypothetical protein
MYYEESKRDTLAALFDTPQVVDIPCPYGHLKGWPGTYQT